MTSHTPPFNDDAPPTEEIYIELRELQAAAEAQDVAEEEPTPVLANDDPTSIKARIARLRAILTDRGAPPPP